MTFKDNHFPKGCTADLCIGVTCLQGHLRGAPATAGRLVDRAGLPTKWTKNIILRVVVYCLLLIAFNRSIFGGFAAFTRLVPGHLTLRSWGGVLYHGAARVLRLADAKDEKCGVL
jgi:hypothetical protein